MFTKLHLATAGGLLAVGAVVATAVWAADAASKPTKNCCELKMACCTDGGSACCAAPDKLGCCEKGTACCKNDQTCCASPQPCCNEGKACCEEGKACCGVKSTKLAAKAGEGCALSLACCESSETAQVQIASCCAAKADSGEAATSDSK